MNMTKRIKTYLLTGFLGAGKTTLLNHLLSRSKSELNYVIENEFGKSSVDAELVIKNYNKLFELNNGCICCSLDNELIEVLVQMIQADTLPDNLFIEASGVADAGQLASIFKREDVIQYFDFQQVVCMVDAENFEDRVQEVPEMFRQIVASDLILINKTDLVQEKYAESVKSEIESINPLAKTALTTFGKFDFDLFDSSAESILTKIDQSKLDAIKPAHRMKSIAMEVPFEFDRDQLYAVLSTSIFLYYHQLYRIKGFVKLKGEDQAVLVQSTGNKLTISNQYKKNESQKLVLIFIGRDIERKGIERLIHNAISSKLKASTI
ncbi:CobW family GTP-binding protein [Indibacter alkaliphilus]|nr:GTP-binding protein [Indibacter alkaliphilus]